MKNLRAPIKDAIDKRNFQESISRSVVKRPFVNYVNTPESGKVIIPEEAPKEKEAKKPPEVMNKVDEIMARLEAEAKEDEIAKSQEWTKKLLEDKPKEEMDHLYNTATNSYSGTYGKGPVDDKSRQLADQILQEKEQQRSDIIRDNQQN